MTDDSKRVDPRGSIPSALTGPEDIIGETPDGKPRYSIEGLDRLAAEAPVELLEWFVGNGAHFVLVRSDGPDQPGKAAWSSWNRQPKPDAATISAHLRKTQEQMPTRRNDAGPPRGPGNIGLHPASMNLVAVDVDHGTSGAMAALIEAANPLAVTASGTAPRVHLWFHRTEDTPDSDGSWEAMGCSGELRANTGGGYVRLYGPALSVVAQAWARRTVHPFPAALFTAPKPKPAPAKAESDGDEAPAGAPVHRNLPLKQIRAAMARIDPAPRENWRKVGMALHAHFGEAEAAARKAWDEWAETTPRRNFDAADQEAAWKSFSEEGNDKGKIEIGTLIKLALDGGWTIPHRYRKQTGKAKRKRAEGGDKPILEKSPQGVKDALDALHLAFRFNTRSFKVEYQLKAGWTETDDRLIGKVRRTISETFDMPRGEDTEPLLFGPSIYADYLGMWLYDAEVDPLIEWLESRAPWDGTERLNHCLNDCFELEGGQDDGLIEWASYSTILGCVARAYRPGLKLDEMVVLIGQQDCGKSTYFAQMLPPKRQLEWFTDGLSFADDDKTKVEAMQGRVLVEVAEMSGATKADIARLKAFLSRPDDGSIRLAYRRDPERMPRRCMLVGTANLDRPLPGDETGNRRFVVVRIRDGDPKRIREYWAMNRDQVWAEALQLFQQGREAWLPAHLKDARRAANLSATPLDEVLEERIRRWIDGMDDGAWFRVSEYLDYAELQDWRPVPSDRKVAMIFRALDCPYLGIVKPQDGRPRARYYTTPPVAGQAMLAGS